MRIRTVSSENGDRVGFQGKRYETQVVGEKGYRDNFDDYLAFLEPRLREAYRLLTPNGSLYFHIDFREVHYCKILLDEIVGRASFINEIIWAYDYGARTRSLAAQAHNILCYAKDPQIIFQLRRDRAHSLHGARPGWARRKPRAASCPRYLVATNVATNSREKNGYPTQNPLAILRASCRPLPTWAIPCWIFFCRLRHHRRGLPGIRPALLWWNNNPSHGSMGGALKTIRNRVGWV